MSAPVWGICGTGGICNDFCLALKHCGSTIGAVAASSADKASKFAADFGAPRSYGSYQELAQDASVTVVYIGTIHTVHVEHATMFLKAGKAVLCEKPMGINSREVGLMVDAAKASGVFFMEAFWTRSFPVIRRIRETLDRGDLGPAHGVLADFGFVAPDDPSHRLWMREKAGGGMLDIGCYVVQAATLTYGFSASPSLKATGELTAEGVDKRAVVSLSYPQGTASLSYGLDCHYPGELKILCERGMIIVDGPSHCPTRARVVKATSRTETTEEVIEEALPVYPTGPEHCGGRAVNYPNSEGLVYEVQEVERCLREGLKESPVFPLEESLAVVGIMDRVRAELGVVYPADSSA